MYINKQEENFDNIHWKWFVQGFLGIISSLAESIITIIAVPNKIIIFCEWVTHGDRKGKITHSHFYGVNDVRLLSASSWCLMVGKGRDWRTAHIVIMPCGVLGGECPWTHLFLFKTPVDRRSHMTYTIYVYAFVSI